MVFGRRDNGYDDDDEDELELVLFQGSLSGKEANLKANARLAQAGLTPAKELVTDAISRRTEMLRIEPKGQRAVVSFYIDGRKYPGARLPGKRAHAVTQMLKLLCGLDVKERSQPQSGGVKAELEDKKFHLLVQSKPTKGGGEELVVKIRNLKQKLNSPDDLGFPDEMRSKLREMVDTHSGIIVTCGGPFSGLSTTSNSVMRCADAYVYSCFSICDLEGHDLKNVAPFEPAEGDDWPMGFDRLKRNEAHVIYVGRLFNDDEMTKLLFERHQDFVFIGELTAKDPAKALHTLIKRVGDPALVAAALRGIVTQRLVRRLCGRCKEAFRPNPKLAKKIGLPPGTKVLYRRPRPMDPDEQDDDYEPCVRCNEAGFIGRTALFELIEMTDQMRELVASGEFKSSDIKRVAKEQDMLTLQKDSIRLIATGISSLEEMKRTFKDK